MDEPDVGLAHSQRALELGVVSTEDDVPVSIMASAHLHLRDFAAAEAGFRRAAEIRRRHRNPYNTAVALANLGDSLRGLGRRDEALTALDEARHIYEELDSPDGVTDCLLITGRVHLHFGHWDEAAASFRAAIDLAGEHRLPAYLQEGTEGLDELRRRRATPA